MPEVKAKIESAFKEDRQDAEGKYKTGQTTFALYTVEEKDYRNFLIKRLTSARDQRADNHVEFDDMDYSTWYDGNAKAANAYIPPKKNQEDTRIVTGTTQEKEHAMLSAVLNYNFEGSIIAYDENERILVEMGQQFEDMVRKSREIEDYDLRRPLIYKEMFDQGNVFVGEIFEDNIQVVKTMNDQDWSKDLSVLSKITWERKLQKALPMCTTYLYRGTNVYLGNIKEFELSQQPYVFTTEYIHYEEAKTIYGDWERWEYVPKRVVNFVPEKDESIDYRDWTLTEQRENIVEIIKFQDKFNNEFQVLINGVMMLPIEFPLTAISPSGEYALAKGDAEPISKFFAYSKSIPSKNKVDQAVLDEVYKLMLLKLRKSYMPPMANNTGKILSRKIFFPGFIGRDINPNQLQPIGEATGVTQSEFAMFELIKKIIDEKSVSAVFSGDQTRSNQTATEILELKKQSMMKLGYALTGIIQLEKQLTKLRIANILANWTKPIDQRIDPARKQLKEIYRTISVDSTFENGVKGNKLIEFNPNKPTDITEDELSDRIKEEEEYLTEKTGVPTRKVYLNPDLINKAKFNFKVIITPTEKDSSELRRQLFVQNVGQAMTLFGQQSVNMDNAKERFATLAGEDPQKFWNKQPEGAIAEQPLPGAPGAPGEQPPVVSPQVAQPQLMQ